MEQGWRRQPARSRGARSGFAQSVHAQADLTAADLWKLQSLLATEGQSGDDPPDRTAGGAVGGGATGNTDGGRHSLRPESTRPRPADPSRGTDLDVTDRHPPVGRHSAPDRAPDRGPRSAPGRASDSAAEATDAIPAIEPPGGRRRTGRHAAGRHGPAQQGAAQHGPARQGATGRRGAARHGGTGTLGRVLVFARRGLAAALSLAVLVGSGYSWTSLNSLRDRLNTTNVIGERPAGASDGATDILLVGSDSRTDANGEPLPLEVLKLLRTEESAGLNTDTLILIRVPNNGGKAHAVSIPRDTYVPIPGYRDDKINVAYGVSKRLAGERLRAAGATDGPGVDRDSRQAGQRVLVQVVEALTGVHVDHYAEINLYGFYLLTEAMGGVEVCLRRDTIDPDSGADFRKGRQLVSGGDALAFVRQRKNLPRGDLDRIVRQQVFMAALANRMLAAGTLADRGRLSGLMEAVQRSVVLDDGWDVLGFAGQLQGLAGGAVQFVTVPVVEVGARNERGQSIITVDPAEVHTFFAGLIGGQAPAPAEQPAPSVLTTPPDAAAVIVSVRNGTDRAGLAGRVMDVLAGHGYRTGGTDNGGLRDRTEVRVGPGGKAVGQQIAATLGRVPVVEDRTLAADRARVLLGADYAGPGAHPAAGARQPWAAGPLVHLDGATGQHTAALGQPTPAGDEPITAEGLTCVN